MASMLADALSVHLGLMLMDEVLGCMCPVHIMYIRDFRNQAFPMFTDNRIRQDQQEMRNSNPPFQAFVFLIPSPSPSPLPPPPPMREPGGASLTCGKVYTTYKVCGVVSLTNEDDR
jgi:hypothetical protein